MQLVHVETAPPAAPAGRPEPELSLVPPAAPGERARQLLQEARSAALEHLQLLQQSIAETRALAETIARNGDLYGVGVEDLARRLAADLEWRSKTLEAL